MTEKADLIDRYLVLKTIEDEPEYPDLNGDLALFLEELEKHFDGDGINLVAHMLINNAQAACRETKQAISEKIWKIKGGLSQTEKINRNKVKHTKLDGVREIELWDELKAFAESRYDRFFE